MLRSRARDDEGSASLEFITAGFILLVPLVYLILVISAIQGGAFAVEGAARQVARVYVEADTDEQARADASAAVEVALADYGIAAADAHVTVSCSPDPDACLTRRGFVTVSVATSIPLPLVPPVIHLRQMIAAPLSSTATDQVSRFAENGAENDR